MTDSLSAEDRIRKVRISFLRERPFFANIAMYLNLVEQKDTTMAVDAEGNLYFNPEFVESLSFDELKFVIGHETLHMAFLHLLRKGERDGFLWNVATDFACNIVLREDGFHVPSKFLYDSKYQGMSAEEIYDSLIKQMKGSSGGNKSSKNQDGTENVSFGNVRGSRFDTHFYPKKRNGNDKEDKDTKGNEKTEQELRKLKDEWKKRVAESETLARQMGRMPESIERMFGNIIESKINWRSLLYRYITQEIPMDSSYARPSKRSQSVGVYLPYQIKENIDIVVAIDSSGSVSPKEMDSFVSEIIAISKSFASIKMTVIVCDCKIHGVHEIRNGFSPKDIKLEGCGGTDFRPVFSYISKNIPSTRLLIYLTDGMGEYPAEESVKTLWVLTNDYNVPFGEKVVMGGE